MRKVAVTSVVEQDNDEVGAVKRLAGEGGGCGQRERDGGEPGKRKHLIS